MRTRNNRSCSHRSQKSYVALPIESKESRLAVGEALLVSEFRVGRPLESRKDDSNTAGNLQLILQSACLKAHSPMCHGVQLAKRYVMSLGRLSMHAGWCLLVPNYIGHHLQIDLAAQAVIAAIDSPKGNPSSNARIAYGHALSALRQQIDFSDSSLVTVALLSLYEATTRMHTPAQFSHRYGIAKIMLSKPKLSSGPSELDRALLYSDWDRRWRVPVALGVVSPFEDPYWLNAEPLRRHSPEQIVRLRVLTNRIYITLPRLILYVRQLREDSGCDVSEAAERTSSLANELLKLKDQDAESFLLHGVKVVPTKGQWDIPIVKYSFEYQTLQQMSFANAYWHSRLILMQLCATILALPGSASLSQSENDIKSETKRMVTNVFMSYQFAQTQNMMGHICIAQPLVACFGALSCLDQWQDLPVSSVKKWIILRMNDSWGNWGRSFSSQDLEEINGVLSGGPLKGLLVQTYEDERHLLVPSSGLGKT